MRFRFKIFYRLLKCQVLFFFFYGRNLVFFSFRRRGGRGLETREYGGFCCGLLGLSCLIVLRFSLVTTFLRLLVQLIGFLIGSLLLLLLSRLTFDLLATSFG
jgi:hypothetical protein